MEKSLEILPEDFGHAGARLALLDRVMGPGRLRKTSERLREGREPVANLCHVAVRDSAVVGTVRMWAIRACGLPDALLLGPLAVDGACQGLGIGRQLMQLSVDKARTAGYGAVILVGDAPYYSRFGFSAHSGRRLAMPGPFERHRLLALQLRPGALDRAHGVLRPCGPMITTETMPASAIAA